MRAETIRTWAAIGMIGAFGVGGLASTSASAQDGLTWATVGDLDNIAYDGGEFGVNAGRGSVGYAYRISKEEVHTAQWFDFVQTFSTQSDELDDLLRPLGWGARRELFYNGPGNRYELVPTVPERPNPALENIGISWRQAAMYCNWLHNGMSSDPAALMDGAYDVSTFGFAPEGGLSDQLTHHPDARFWIPTLDEYLKAAHYDPAKSTDETGAPVPGWWAYGHRSDELPVPGLPGEGDSAQGLDPTELGVLFSDYIGVGAYPESVSPWGLLDVLGGSGEWTEEPALDFRGRFFGRQFKQSSHGIAPDEFNDLAWAFGAGTPTSQRGSFRIATVVPATGSQCLVALVCSSVCLHRRRRS
ncbi:MAG: SUMF1/EgtB/PvdO family nonheme iron enzyme [Planctomycetota bacterium]